MRYPTLYGIFEDGLGRKSLSILKFDEVNCETLDSRKGTIYIDLENNTWKLFSTWNWLNDQSKIYPVNLDQIYFDKHISDKDSPIIRIINSNGEEKMVLGKPHKVESIR